MSEEITEGIYQYQLSGERIVFEVMKTMQGQWPSKTEILMAHPLSGEPRFPRRILDLKEFGGTFKRLI